MKESCAPPPQKNTNMMKLAAKAADKVGKAKKFVKKIK